MTQSTSQSVLNAADRKKFAALRIPDELLSRAGVRRVSDAEARLDFGIKGSAHKDMSGIVYPYYHLKTGYRVTARVRLDNPEFKDGKPQGKYVAAYGDSRHLFFGPGAGQQLQDPESSTALVESEKATLTLAAWADRKQQKIVPIGMGGCYGYLGRIGKRITSNGDRIDEVGVLSDLDCVNGRRVYVLLDSNAESNPKVKKARNALVRELKQRDCKVLICHLPQIDGVNGPDDYISLCGDEAMAQVFATATAGRLTHDYDGGRFEVGEERGVEYEPPPDKDGNSKTPLWLSSPLHILAKTRDSRSGEWGRLLEWQDADGAPHRWSMPMLLRRDGGTEVLCELEREGLDVAAGKAVREYLPIYLRIWPTDRRARCVNRLGWCNMPSKTAQYLLPAEVIGSTTEPVVFQSMTAIQPAFSVSGTADEWKENVAALAQGNSRMVFAISCAFAGPVLDLTGENSGGFHFRGISSIGKSITLTVGASVWGDPRKYCRTWRHTVNGLEAVAALHNDGFLPLDELGQVDPKDAGECAYLLSNGQGKSRATRYGTARPLMNWRLLFLSAGEQSLASLMAQVNRKPTVGQQIRMAEIEADAGVGMGVVEYLHSYETSSALMLAMRDQAQVYHGAAGVKYLQMLVRERNQDGGQLAEYIDGSIRKFVEGVTQADVVAGGQVERVARRFALVGTGGELASKYGLTGWPEGAAMKAAGVCFVSWLNLFGGSGNREERQLLEQARAFFEANGSSRFENVNGGDGQRIINRAGFYRVVETETIDGYEVPKKGGQRQYLVLPQAFRNELCLGFDFNFAARALKKHGWLIPGSDRTAQSIALPGMGKTRAYVISAKLWEDGK
jgi:uncharacterized protein (DUF927 family)